MFSLTCDCSTQTYGVLTPDISVSQHGESHQTYVPPDVARSAQHSPPLHHVGTNTWHASLLCMVSPAHNTFASWFRTWWMYLCSAWSAQHSSPSCHMLIHHTGINQLLIALTFTWSHTLAQTMNASLHLCYCRARLLSTLCVHALMFMCKSSQCSYHTHSFPSTCTHTHSFPNTCTHTLIKEAMQRFLY